VSDLDLLLLVDAHHLAYRAFHAVPVSLRAPNGMPTGVVLGVVRSVRALRQSWNPTHMAIVWDGGIPEERRKLFPDYKAQRPPMPDALGAQLELLSQFFPLEGISCVRKDGEESDDVIATLAHAAANDGAQVLFASGDKDLLQLVRDRIRAVRPDKPAAGWTAEDVRNHIGVRPEQIPDFLALIGDAVDHIPGVPGVGPKTAQRWLAQYGTISELLRHVDELEPSRLRDRVRVAQDVLQRNLALVRLRTCVEGLPPWRELELRNPVEPERREFLEKLGLKSLILAPASPMLL